MDLHFSPKVAKFAFSTEMKLFIHARNSASFGGMYLVIRHHLANEFRRPCVFSCQMAIDSHQTTIDSHQTTIDSYQTAIDSHQTTIDSHQTTIDSYQTTMDSYQTTMDRRQVNRTAGECSRARRMGRMSHKAMSRGTARRAPTPYQQGQGERGSTPAAEVEQHL
jgi:transcription elongation factor Elf1